LYFPLFNSAARKKIIFIGRMNIGAVVSPLATTSESMYRQIIGYLLNNKLDIVEKEDTMATSEAFSRYLLRT
jgi:hypothetical protein